MTLPGMGAISATALMAAIGDVSRFPSSRHLVAYLGLNPRVHQSGSEPARHGRISKQGPGEARHLLVEAAWHAIRAAADAGLRRAGAGPSRRQHRHRGRRAQARGDRLAHADPRRGLRLRAPLVREKLRRLELMLGAPSRQGRRNPQRVFASVEGRAAEMAQARRAEAAYRQLMRDRAAGGVAGATPGRVKTPTMRRGSAADL